MERSLAPIRAALDDLQDDLARLQGDMGHIRRLAAIVEPFLPLLTGFLIDRMQTWNRGSGSSRDAPLQVVPFVDGVDPTTGEVICLKFCLPIPLLITFIPAPSPGS